MHMPILATPESGIPFPFDTSPEELLDFRAKAHALFATLQELDAPIDITDDDRQAAHDMFEQEEILPPNRLTAGSIATLEALLSEWDHEVLDVHRRLRNYVTNKLLLESNDEDPKIRLKALELLGKTSGVNAFSDRVDISVTHRTVADIEVELRKTLEMYTDYTVVEPEPEPSPVLIEAIDVDQELGTSDGS
jgi:hypothetical protein